MKFLKNIKQKGVFLWHSLFHGMSGAEKAILSPKSDDNQIGVVQQIGGGGVFADMLEKKETQQVVEMRDKYYRVYKESDNYDTSTITIASEDENGVVFGNTNGLKKKTKGDFIKHPPVYNPNNLQLRTIQDNKHIEKKKSLLSINESSDSINELIATANDFDVTLTIERDGITPRFFLEKYTKKIVVFENNNRAIVDLYIPSEASMFGKIDAMLIANLHRMKEEKTLKSDLTDIIGFEWYSDKAWNTGDVCLFKYDDIKFIGIDIFDGSFVLSFDCNVVENGRYLAEKFITKELDEKYATEAAKSDVIDIFAYNRKLDRDKSKKQGVDVNNLGNTTLKLS
jgi:hypothetical protein